MPTWPPSARPSLGLALSGLIQVAPDEAFQLGALPVEAERPRPGERLLP